MPHRTTTSAAGTHGDPSGANSTGALFAFDDSFVRDVPELSIPFRPRPVPGAESIALNEDLATELGIDVVRLRSPEGIDVLAGNETPVEATPVAMAYAGHQFGGYSPRLGDGRAVLLGELTDREGRRVDLHLKGSGRTPFSRGGDGKAALGPMLREFLFAEAMHALTVPTSRALAVVGTGEHIPRDGPVPGAVLTRVAASHLRVGTFEYAVRLDDPTILPRLADHAIARHYPLVAELDNPYLGLLEAVVDAQASLVARWMLVGFVHGVMNTDNVSIAGETIDYGPCAFMDHYDPATVFSSIDRNGRYAYRNQPGITQWNLTRLAETLLAVIDDEPEVAIASATAVLESFPDRYRNHWTDGMRAKLGLTDPTEVEQSLFDDYLQLLAEGQVDYTSSFRALSASLRGDHDHLDLLFADRDALDRWIVRWRSALDSTAADPAMVADAMDSVNPIYIPRNHLVEEALGAAENGDTTPFADLLAVVTRPFAHQPDVARYADPAPASFNETFQTFCGT